MTEFEHYINGFKPEVRGIPEAIEQGAQALIDRAKVVPGPKYLAVLVEDSPFKIGCFKDDVNNTQPQLSAQIVLHSEKDFNDAIDFIVALQEINSKEQILPLVVFMDGNLKVGNDRKTGLAVTTELFNRIKARNLPLPFLVGASWEPYHNEAIESRFPDQYVETWGATEARPVLSGDLVLGVFQDIESRVCV